MTDIIVQLKNIKDELEKVCPSAQADSLEKAMELCAVMEQLELAKYHLLFAINKLIIYRCFERKDDVGSEVAQNDRQRTSNAL
jgi:hypothetical protein